jgi:hypothetical protein
MIKAIAFKVSLLTGLIILFAGAFVFGAASNDSPGYDKVTIFGAPSGSEISDNALVTGWKYHILIKLSSATPMADYQVKIVLNNSTFDYSKAKSDGGDIRFYDLAGNKLSYWIQEWNPTGASIIWVKILILRTSAISMYCGNEGATSESNGDSTFDFFDHFDGTTIDTTKWIISQPGAFTVNNSWVTCTGAGGYPSLHTKNEVGATSFIVEQELDVVQVGSEAYHGYVNEFWYGNLDGVCWYAESDPWDRYIYINSTGYPNGFWAPGPNKGMTTGQVHMTVVKGDSSIRWITDGSRNFDDSWTGATVNHTTRLWIFLTHLYYIVKVDWVFLRNYNQPPTAVIDSISPSPAGEGQPVTFGGHGVDTDGSIVGYNWRSSIDGQLSTQASFTRSDLSNGSHIIYFKVQDDDSEWSEEVSQALEITPEYWQVSWSYPPPPPPELRMYDWYQCTLVATNTGTNTQSFDYGLSLTPHPLNSFGNEVTPGWPLEEKSECLLNGAPYVFGTQMAEAIGPNETRTYIFNVANGHWNWIKPWSLDRIALVFINIMTAGIYGDIQWAFTTIQFLQMLSPWFETVPSIKYSYTGLGNAAQGSSGNVEVKVLQLKQNFLWGSIQTAGAASFYTTLGFACFIFPWTTWMAPYWFTLEYILYGVSEAEYAGAVDPDSNFTELASPQPWPWHESVLDSAPSGAKSSVLLAMELYSITNARTTSYARYLGALVAGEAKWTAVQLAATKYYMQQQVFIAHELSTLAQIAVDSVPIPSPEDIQNIRDSLSQNGLPEIEVDGLRRLGFSDMEIDSLTMLFLSANDDFYTSFTQLPQIWQDFSAVIETSIATLPEPPGGVKLADLGTDPDTLSLTGPPSILNCWVEFPKDSNITGYQIISGILNDTIQASYISPTPGDYDNDGIPDIAMQFSTTTLILMLQPGQRLLSVSGDVVLPSADTVLYSGAAILTVLEFMRGDANRDGVIDISDVVYLLNYLFVGGPAPVPLEAGDVTCDGVVDASDLVYLLNYLFVNGPPPGC